MGISSHTRDQLIGWGFGLAYMAAMVALLSAEASRLAPVRDELVGFGCVPAFVAGLLMLAGAYLLPQAGEPLIEDASKVLRGEAEED